jgi:hypothetical protein
MTNTSSGQNYMFLAIFTVGTRSLANKGFDFVQFVNMSEWVERHVYLRMEF